MTFKKTFCLFILFILTSSITNSQSKIDFSKLVGKWKFVKFDWPNFVPDTARIKKESDKNFKDAVYNFTKDKRLIITQTNVPKGYSTNLTYSVKGEKVYVLPLNNPKAQPQVLEIDLLNESLLKFYVVGMDPVGTFKRVKE
ncbi:MAG: hypothetical protein QM541_13000 [Flavobacterium sp.]|nr:hypothetical protein [Flavobacterium sp.]